VPLAVFAFLAWSFQRLLSKVALKSLTTAQFYLLSAVVSLIVYGPYLLVHPLAAHGLVPALGVNGHLKVPSFGQVKVPTQRMLNRL
jgi:hypothetical protein